MLLTNFTLAWARSPLKGGCVQLSMLQEPPQVALRLALTPSAGPVSWQPLGTGQTRSPYVWHRCGAMWWLLKEGQLPASASTHYVYNTD